MQRTFLKGIRSRFLSLSPLTPAMPIVSFGSAMSRQLKRPVSEDLGELAFYKTELLYIQWDCLRNNSLCGSAVSRFRSNLTIHPKVGIFNKSFYKPLGYSKVQYITNNENHTWKYGEWRGYTYLCSYIISTPLDLVLKFEKRILNSIKHIIFTRGAVVRAGFGENLNFSILYFTYFPGFSISWKVWHDSSAYRRRGAELLLCSLVNRTAAEGTRMSQFALCPWPYQVP